MTKRPPKLNPVPDELRRFAKGQRSTMPKAEDLFWTQVRAGRFRGLKFRRQVPITPYVVDFLCAGARVVVELDGPPHESREARAKDAARDRFLRSEGFEVLRFSNVLVFGNCGLVLEEVGRVIEARLAAGEAERG